MPTTPQPILTLQTATLWASGDNSTFSGTGGPAAFDPFLGEFSDVVSSSGLATEPFQDTLYNVDAGDQVTFVIALQNFGSVAGYNIKLRDTLPVGFAIASSDLTVQDGAGNMLATTGNLFSTTDGMTITAPVAAYSDNAGTNVVLITFTAYATNSISLPGATVTNSAQVLNYAASNGGANLLGGANSPRSSSTSVQTGSLAVTSVADQPAATLAAGQTASFDVTVTLPEGSVQDFRIDEALPQIGSSWLQLVSAQIVSVGSHLTPSAPVIVQPSGSIQLGTVIDAYDNLVTAADQVVVRVTVRGAGPSGGSGTINTVVSTADPNNAGARISTTVTNTLTLGTPDTPPTITGVSAAQFSTASMRVLPFQNLTLTDPDAGQVQTLTIHLSNPALGAFSGVAFTTNGAGDTVLTGSVATVQAAARALLFTPSAAGTETIGLTLDDGAGDTVLTGSVATVQAAARALLFTPSAAGTETIGLTLDDGAGGLATTQETLTIAAAAHPRHQRALPDLDTDGPDLDRHR